MSQIPPLTCDLKWHPPTVLPPPPKKDRPQGEEGGVRKMPHEKACPPFPFSIPHCFFAPQRPVSLSVR